MPYQPLDGSVKVRVNSILLAEFCNLFHRGMLSHLIRKAMNDAITERKQHLAQQGDNYGRSQLQETTGVRVESGKVSGGDDRLGDGRVHQAKQTSTKRNQKVSPKAKRKQESKSKHKS